MKVINHFLYFDDGQQVRFVKSPNIEGKMQPEYLVIHYTAGSTAAGAVTWLTNSRAYVSAHLVIGRDGSITQLVPFDTVAWHAGASMWEGREGLNKYSIGIELDNAGRLLRKGGEWLAGFGKVYADDEVIEAYHKNGKGPYGWHTYSEKQLEVALEAGLALFEAYKLLDVVGHDDIAPHRKIDPGPAFPMDSFRAKLLGRMEIAPPLYETTIDLNIRSGPGSEYKRLAGSPLPKGTRLEKLKFEGSWMFVDVLDEVNGIMDLQGWVHGRYVRRVIPEDPEE
jgi:N-acetylmuramoyl-L-alanine amidase